MKYKEFKEKIKSWERKYNDKTVVEVDYDCIYMKFDCKDSHSKIFDIHKSERFVIDLDWISYRKFSDDAKKELFKIVTEFAATPTEERKDEKRFIIPLPGLITSDGKQQYLTHKDCKFFASRRDETLQQIWKEEHLELIPEQYRQFAMELVLK